MPYFWDTRTARVFTSSWFYKSSSLVLLPSNHMNSPDCKRWIWTWMFNAPVFIYLVMYYKYFFMTFQIIFQQIKRCILSIFGFTIGTWMKQSASCWGHWKQHETRPPHSRPLDYWPSLSRTTLSDTCPGSWRSSGLPSLPKTYQPSKSSLVKYSMLELFLTIYMILPLQLSLLR